MSVKITYRSGQKAASRYPPVARAAPKARVTPAATPKKTGWDMKIPSNLVDVVKALKDNSIVISDYINMFLGTYKGAQIRGDGGDLIILTVDAERIDEKWPLMYQCRGVIVDKAERKMLVWPTAETLPAEYADEKLDTAEKVADIDDNLGKGNLRVYEFVDGTNLALYYYGGKWRLGSVRGYDVSTLRWGADAPTFAEMFYLAAKEHKEFCAKTGIALVDGRLTFKDLDEGYSYSFVVGCPARQTYFGSATRLTFIHKYRHNALGPDLTAPEGWALPGLVELKETSRYARGKATIGNLRREIEGYEREMLLAAQRGALAPLFTGYLVTDEYIRGGNCPTMVKFPIFTPTFRTIRNVVYEKIPHFTLKANFNDLVFRETAKDKYAEFSRKYQSIYWLASVLVTGTADQAVIVREYLPKCRSVYNEAKAALLKRTATAAELTRELILARSIDVVSTQMAKLAVAAETPTASAPASQPAAK